MKCKINLCHSIMDDNSVLYHDICDKVTDYRLIIDIFKKERESNFDIVLSILPQRFHFP